MASAPASHGICIRRKVSDDRFPECFGSIGDGSASEPFGPLHDDTKWASRGYDGEPRYVVDLGKDPDFARVKLHEMRTENFLSLRHTRRAFIMMTLYNSALPMFSFLELSFEISPTGEFTSRVEVEGMNVQEYMADTWWFQALLEILLVVWTSWHIKEEVEEVRTP